MGYRDNYQAWLRDFAADAQAVAELKAIEGDEKEIEDRVNTILEDLDLSKIRDLAVGSPIRKTISGGQRKRLNIALELIREPAILYLDEPTSGLSSTDSEKVIMLLKEQTHRGRLVVVNIHQPSSEIYKLFDRLWLLDTGGFTTVTRSRRSPTSNGLPITPIRISVFAAPAEISIRN